MVVEPTRYTIWFEDGHWCCQTSDNGEHVEADKLGSITWWIRRNQKVGR